MQMLMRETKWSLIVHAQPVAVEFVKSADLHRSQDVLHCGKLAESVESPDDDDEPPRGVLDIDDPLRLAGAERDRDVLHLVWLRCERGDRNTWLFVAIGNRASPLGVAASCHNVDLPGRRPAEFHSAVVKHAYVGAPGDQVGEVTWDLDLDSCTRVPGGGLRVSEPDG